MKTAVILCVLSLLWQGVVAQKVERYLEITMGTKWKKGKNVGTVEVSFGEDTTLLTVKDKLDKEKIMAVERYSNGIDVFNYLASLGWTLVSAIPYLSDGNTVGYNYYFKTSLQDSAKSRP